MANGNGHKEAEEKRKWCPVLGEYCIGERCALSDELVKQRGNLVQKRRLCSFVLTNALLSEVLKVLAQQGKPQEKIVLPGDFKAGR